MKKNKVFKICPLHLVPCTLLSGQTLIEILIAIGLCAILLPAIFLGLYTTRNGKAQQVQRQAAIELLTEYQEAVRNIRNGGWSSFYAYGNGTFYPTIDAATNSWKLIACGSPNPPCPTVNGFSAQVTISDVYRDPITHAIAVTGDVDASTKKIVTTVSWSTPTLSSVSSTAYLTRYLDNLSQQWTTLSDFTGVSPNISTTANTSIVNNSGGEVILSAGGGGGDWCQPNKSITTVDLPKNGVANAVKAIEGHVFAGTGDNASGVSFAHITLTTNGDPPVATPAATFDGYKTNTVFGEPNYAYLGTDNNSKEVVILSLTQYSDPPTNSKYLEIGSINLPNAQNGNSIYVYKNIAYVLGSDGKMYDYDITTRSGSHSTALNSGLALSGTGMKVSIATDSATLKTYAYVMTSATTNQLQIVDVTNPNSPTIVGQKTLGSGQAGRDLYVNATGSRVYGVTAYSSTNTKDFFIVDTTTKTNPQLLGSYSTSGMDPKGVTVVTGNRAIVVGTGGTTQYQVLNITTETNPVSCGPGLSYSTGVYGVDSVLQSSNGYAYSYIITGDTSSELKIILGGAGGNYSGTGTYTSNYLDSSSFGLSQTAFNRYQANFINLSQTTIGFQMAVANAVSGSCVNASYTFIGPNKTTSSTDLFTASTGAIPIWSSGSYQNPGQCFKYKVYMSSKDSTQTPELDDFSVNFSP